jgi:hypothetical protein
MVMLMAMATDHRLFWKTTRHRSPSLSMARLPGRISPGTGLIAMVDVAEFIERTAFIYDLFS